MKIYSYNSATIQPATSLTWNEITNQSIIDNVKNQEGTPWTYATATSGNTAQMMIELDLTPLVNSLSGGSTVILRLIRLRVLQQMFMLWVVVLMHELLRMELIFNYGIIISVLVLGLKTVLI
jgi:hypothetical protein